MGTLKRVADTAYSVFMVINGEAWPPPEFGIYANLFPCSLRRRRRKSSSPTRV